MSYTPTTWKAGDTVTSAKLNKMEQGIVTANDIEIIHIIENPDSDYPYTLDKTWQEILDSDKVCIILNRDQDSNTKTQELVTYVSEFDGDYQVFTTIDGLNGTTPHRYVAYSSDGYPHDDY